MSAPVETAIHPKVRPAGLNAASPTYVPSTRSRALARYYSSVQSNLLARGLLRTGGGGIDTPYTGSDLLRNFERIAFYDEYARNGGLRKSDGTAGGLAKWAEPVRMSIEFGASVPEEKRQTDAAVISAYAARLSRITGHPISVDNNNSNFHILIVGEDDKEQTRQRLGSLMSTLNTSSISFFDNLPRSVHCLVVAFARKPADYTYFHAVALIRAEHPDLLRRSCVHEELAQGLGLTNDSPRARPSIFNDDDEFALLTTHDEELLRLLYNRALTPGMTPAQARPILTNLIRQRHASGI